MNQGIHTIDLLGWLLGPVRRVMAQTATLVHDIEVEDTALAILEFACGARATCEATTVAYPGYARRVEITTERGTVTIEQGRVIAADLLDGGDDLVDPAATAAGGASTPVVSDVSGHATLMADFVAAARDGREPLCSGADARRSMAIAQAIYESARTGATAQVDDRYITDPSARRPGGAGIRQDSESAPDCYGGRSAAVGKARSGTARDECGTASRAMPPSDGARGWGSQSA